jgi:ABC-type sugar transport system ATPase subunit
VETEVGGTSEEVSPAAGHSAAFDGDGAAHGASPGGVTAPLFEARGIGKHFGAVVSLDGVDLVAHAGEVHALTGANGAGKSTFMNLVAGVYAPSAGELLIDGTPVRFGSPRAARDAGISVVYQELTVLPELTVAENVFLAREPRTRFGALDRRAMNDATARLLAEFGLALDPRRKVGELNVATQQLVELARALSLSARLLILDEPTAVLSPAERDGLFRVVGALKEKGLLVFFVTHRLDEVFELADRVTVLRNGRRVVTASVGTLDRAALVRHMVGHDVAERATLPEPSARAPTLRIEHRSAGANGALQLRGGEIVGLAGLVGSGRTRLARRIAGLERGAEVEVEIDGTRIAIRSARDAVEAGIVYLTEDRKRDGLFVALPVLHNATASTLARYTRAGFIDGASERRSASDVLDRLGLVARSLAAPVRELSGGNQQKVMFGRALLGRPRLLICDEPTRGVDVGARDEIYRTLLDLAAAGVPIILISSELKELLMLSHRLLVMRDGAVVAELPGGATEQQVLLAGAVVGPAALAG